MTLPCKLAVVLSGTNFWWLYKSSIQGSYYYIIGCHKNLLLVQKNVSLSTNIPAMHSKSPLAELEAALLLTFPPLTCFFIFVVLPLTHHQNTF